MHGEPSTSPPELIRTQRLVLRRPVAGDAAAIYEHGSDPDATRWMDWKTRNDAEEAARYIEESQSLWAAGEEYGWVITECPALKVIGSISCRVSGSTMDFGFILNPRYWGNGFATEASHAIVDWAVATKSITRIWATCDVENTASARVLEKVGLVREGILQNHVVRPNISPEPRDALLYALVRKT